MNKIKEFFINFWNKVRESKLNMGMFLLGLIASILLVVIFCIVIFRDGSINNEIIVEDTPQATSEEDTTTEEDTTKKIDEEFTTKLDENETKNVVSSPSTLSVKSTVSQSWTDKGENYIQYNLKVTNISEKDINGWGLVLDMTSQYELVDTSNFTHIIKNKKLIINPLNDNKAIKAGESVTIGFIVKGNQYVYIDYYTTYVGSKIETVKNSSNYIPQSTTPKQTTTPEETTTLKETSEVTTTPEATTPPPEETTTPPEETTTPKSTDPTNPTDNEDPSNKEDPSDKEDPSNQEEEPQKPEEKPIN